MRPAYFENHQSWKMITTQINVLCLVCIWETTKATGLEFLDVLVFPGRLVSPQSVVLVSKLRLCRVDQETSVYFFSADDVHPEVDVVTWALAESQLHACMIELSVLLWHYDFGLMPTLRNSFCAGNDHVFPMLVCDCFTACACLL